MIRINKFFSDTIRKSTRSSWMIETKMNKLSIFLGQGEYGENADALGTLFQKEKNLWTIYSLVKPMPYTEASFGNSTSLRGSLS